MEKRVKSLLKDFMAYSRGGQKFGSNSSQSICDKAQPFVNSTVSLVDPGKKGGVQRENSRPIPLFTEIERIRLYRETDLAKCAD
jgi:hypothetical protein